MLVRVGIILHEHQADERRMHAVGEVIRRAGLEDRIPITFSMTGTTIDALGRCCPDVVAGMRWDFANHLTGWDPYRPEVVVSTQHNNPLILPWLELPHWGTYLSDFASVQVGWSKGASEGVLHRTPLGFFPSEMLFAPAAAHMLSQLGLEYCLIAGEPLRPHERGHLYRVPHGPESRLKLLPRVPDFAIGQPRYADAYRLKDEMKEHGRRHGLAHMVVGCDLGEFTGLYHCEGRGGVPLEDGLARLAHLANAVYHDPDMELMNCAGISRAYWHPHSVYDLYRSHGSQDPHHCITTWMNGDGDLGSVHAHAVAPLAEFVRAYPHLPWRERERLRNAFFERAGMERLMDWFGLEAA